MKTFIKTALVLSTCLCLSACMQYVWVKPVGDPTSFAADNYNCKQSAMSNAPPVFQTYDSSPYAYQPQRVRTDCTARGMHEVCYTHVSPPQYVPPPTTVDLNSRNRSELYNACMNALGWILQPVEDTQ